MWSGQLLIVVPLGASCVLLFGYLASPLAQPRNIVLGNGIGGLVDVALVLALAVGLTICWASSCAACIPPPVGWPS